MDKKARKALIAEYGKAYREGDVIGALFTCLREGGRREKSKYVSLTSH